MTATAPSCAAPPGPHRLVLAAFWISAGILLIFSATHLARAWATGSNLGQSSGVTIGQAMDAADGVFYRPLISDRGYGGTRYMPLNFLLMAPFIKLGLSPVHTAYALTFLTDVALLAGLYTLFRRVNIERAIALPASVLILAAATAQYAATTVRADLLPATLNVWGLAFAISAGKETARPRLLLAALFFTLAFTAKFTALYGVAAAVLTMLFYGEWKNAFKLAAFTFIGMVLALGAIHLASDGRFLENMRACATGGTDWETIRRGWRKRIEQSFANDRITLAILILAAISMLRLRLDHLRQTPLWVLLITVALTASLFTSPGVGYNNLLDLAIVALILIVMQVARRRFPINVGICVLAGLALAGTWWNAKRHDKGLTYARAEQILSQLPPPSSDSAGPFLCKPPMLHVYAGEAPYILDPWMLRYLARKDPQFLHPLYEKLRAGHFRAVLVGDVESETGETEASHQFGPGFVAALDVGYAPAGQADRGRFTIYRPRASLPTTQPSLSPPSTQRTAPPPRRRRK